MIVHFSYRNRDFKKIGRKWVSADAIMCARATVVLPEGHDSSFASHKVTCYLCLEKMIEQKESELASLKETLSLTNKNTQKKELNKLLVDRVTKIRKPLVEIDQEILDRV